MQRVDIKKMSLAFALVSGVTGGNVLKGAAVGTVVGGTVGYISDQ